MQTYRPIVEQNISPMSIPIYMGFRLAAPRAHFFLARPAGTSSAVSFFFFEGWVFIQESPPPKLLCSGGGDSVCPALNQQAVFGILLDK